MQRPQDHPPNIVLMGMRASGKTSIARILSQRIRWRYIDLDEETMAAFGDCESVSEAWRKYGEAEFRALELIALQRVLGMWDRVIALGGGSPISPEGEQAVEDARDAGEAFTIYLKAPAAVLRARLEADEGDRPALRGKNALDELDEILAERDPIYTRLADRTVNAALPPAEVINEILQAMREYDDQVDETEQ